MGFQVEIRGSDVSCKTRALVQAYIDSIDLKILSDAHIVVIDKQ